MKIFLTSSANMVLDKMLPELPLPARNFKVLFIPTASDPYGENTPWMDADRNKLIDIGFNVTDFDLKNKTDNETREAINKSDIIFVGGGNTFYLLEKMKASGFDIIINEFKDSDKIYIGSSAGSCVAGPDIEPIAVLDDPNEAQLGTTKSLSLVDFIVLPHANNPKYFGLQEKVKKEFGDKYKIIQIRDEEYLNKFGERFGTEI